METSFQKIIAAIVGVLIFFIVPVYIAFEKVDDVSYTLALKLTRNFVENVRNKGYISPEMYSDFVSGLYATKNSYDVDIEHVKKRYDPAIYIYERKEDGQNGKIIDIVDYDRYITTEEKLPEKIKIDGLHEYTNGVNANFEILHVVNEEIIKDKQIIDRLFANTSITKLEFLRHCMLGNTDMYKTLRYINENSYVMKEGDQINVVVKNKNQTIASVFYSMITANVGNEDIAKIYVNYGGTIRNSGDTIINEVVGDVADENGRIFKYKGNAEEITLEPGVYQIEAWGASGGGFEENETSTTGGKGSYVKGVYEISEETTLYVYVGGHGTAYSESNKQNGGYNGGGNSYNGFGGGGATDVRLLKGEWNDTSSLLTRIIVAAGGGGSSKKNDAGTYGNGGAGGNSNKGLDGAPNITYKGIGATYDEVSVGHELFNGGTNAFGEIGIEVKIESTEKGNLGLGGSVDFDGAGAGGSGYFGGSAAHDQFAGGGGGLSYVYMNNRTYVDGKYYPALREAVLNYTEEFGTHKLNSLMQSGFWKGINYLSAEPDNGIVKAGNEIMRNPFEFLANYTMTGNKGNGVVIIKKIG